MLCFSRVVNGEYLRAEGSVTICKGAPDCVSRKLER